MGFLAIARGDFHLGSEFTMTRTILEQSPADILETTILGNLRSNRGGYEQTSEIVLFAGFIRVFPHEIDYDYFKYYTNFLVCWIPRIVWPSRPDPTQEKITELLAVLGTSHRSGPTPTMLGMFYMHLGVVSVFLLSVLTGLYLAVIDAHGRLIFVSPSAAVVFISLAGGALSIPVGLGVLADIPTLLPFTVAPMMVGLWWARDRRRTTRGVVPFPPRQSERRAAFSRVL
jgi:hypothetical protein